MAVAKTFTVGIDAANLRRGGGVTHLVEFLRAATPVAHNFGRIIIWGSSTTLAELEERSWLDKRTQPELEAGALKGALWQRFKLSSEAHKAGCDILLIPGGSYMGDFHPVVVMNRNLLPFEIRELLRYKFSLFSLKLLLLRLVQTLSLKRADGIIFLTKYAKKVVLEVTGGVKGQIGIVPHGLSTRFKMAPRIQRDIGNYSNDRPYRMLYVSIIDLYKHQSNVVEAAALLRKQGLPLTLELVGPSTPVALKKLNQVIDRVDRERSWVHYIGAVSFAELHLFYENADLGIFASSCENMPNILLETMASGLPIACSKLGPMPEILGDGGIYFDPEDSIDIASALFKLINSIEIRERCAQISYKNAQEFSWKRCQSEIFEFLNSIIKKSRN